jgi:subtilase family serine protease
MLRTRVTAVFPFVSFLLLAAPIDAGQLPQTETRTLPDYDSRAGQPPVGAAPAAVTAALSRLQTERGQALQMRRHRLTGAVRRLAMRGATLTPRAAGAPEAIAAAFVRTRADLLGLRPDEVSTLVRSRMYSSAGERLTHVYFDQIVDGIRVFEGFVGVHVDRGGAIVWLTNDTMPTDARARMPLWSAEDAIRAAVTNVRPEIAIEPVRRSGPAGADRAGVFEPGPLASPIDVRLVYFPTRGGLLLAWQTYIEPQGFPQAYVIIVDAVDGRILYRRNTYRDTQGTGRIIQSDAAYGQDPRRPDAHPLGAAPSGQGDPWGGCPPPQAYLVRDLVAPFRDPQTVLFDTPRLMGNNVTVYRGGVGMWGALGVNIDGAWSFDFPFNTADSVETSVFFALNYAHDLFYDLGFDEAAGNFQVDNFGRGGLGADPLVVVTRAEGRNNANISVPVDGQSPRMNLFLWDGQGCWAEDVDGDGISDLDGGYDADIVVHEYHHGLTFRVNPAWSGSEAGAIGEGGGDFFAYSLFGNPDLAEYAAPPAGIRHVNAKTYADWFCFLGLVCEVHDNGEIWANVLWDLRERFRADLVAGSDGAAIREVHQLYVDGLKLSPARPTMLDMRDAMLQADVVRNPEPGAVSANYCRLWQVFATRGMGTGARDTEDTGSLSVVADFGVPAECPALTVVSIAATTASAFEAGPSPGTFTISRTGEVSRDLVVDYTVTGTATPGTDYAALSGQATIPAGVASVAISVTPIDDPLFEPDETVTVTISAPPGYIVGAPSHADVTIVSDDPAPDLTMSAFAAPAVAAAGGTIAISDTTTNRGGAPAGSSITRFYLSANFLLDAGDTELASRAVGALAAGAASAAVTGTQLPPDLGPTIYYLFAKADADQEVAESQESNNTAFVTLRVGPDLVVSSLTVPMTAGAGSAVTVSDTTTNQGGAPAGGSIVRFYLSTNLLPDGTDRLLGERAVGPLPAGAASTGDNVLTVPSDVGPGQYYVIAQADGAAAVAESIEANNTRFAGVRIGSDLAETALSAPASAGPGSSIVVTETVTNLGGGTSGPSTTRCYLSIDALVDANDLPLAGGRSVPALAAGATSPGSSSYQIPSSTPAGRYYLIAVADADGVVTETNEANNTRAAWLTVGGDLVVTSLSGPTVATAGATILVTDTTGNQGSGSAAASTTRFFLSANIILDPADARLAQGRAVPALASGQSSVGSTSLTLPADAATGAYYLFAKADGDETVPEGNETNNSRFMALAIGPDLVVSSLVVPLKGGAGNPLSVTETTKNQGGGAAAASATRLYLSLDFRLDATDVPLEPDRPVPALAGGATSTATTLVTIPAGTVTGTYFLIAQADGGGVIAETSEANNSRFGSVRVGPDLAVTNLVAPASAVAGAAISVTDTVANQGGGAAGASTTRFYLSTDLVLGAADVQLDGGRLAGPLAPDATSTGQAAVTLPAGIAPGVYFLIAKADGDEAIVETLETNNTRFRSLQVLAGGESSPVLPR